MNNYSIDLKIAVQESHSIASVIRKMGLVPAGGNYQTIKNQISKEKIDTSHFTGRGHLKGKTHDWAKKLSLKEVLVENRFYNTNMLRKRLIKEGRFDHKCSCCELRTWMNYAIPLELDHMNGLRDDNRIENLRLLCPNCHALTPNYRGKNIKKCRVSPAGRRRITQNDDRVGSNPSHGTKKCKDCESPIDKRGVRCKSCFNKSKVQKIVWPDIETLTARLKLTSYCALAQELGISDNAVKKRLKNHSTKSIMINADVT